MRLKLKRSDLVAVLIGLCAAAAAWAFDTHGCGCGEAYYHVRTLEIDANRKVRITAQSWSEVSQGLCSEILDDGKLVSPPFSIGCISHSTSTSELRFGLLMSDDRDIVALVEESSPDVVLMLHRFSTGEHYRGGEGPWDEYYAKMNAILDHLRCGLRRAGLVLSDQVPGNVHRKVQ